MVLKNKKKHKILCNNNVGVGEDKISKLPDALIHHILSFLPTKCVMSTCVLSKRWKYVSNSVPTLDFRQWQITNVTADENPLKTQQFMNFLDTVLYLHEKSKIQNFCLTFGDNHPFDEARVNKWIGIVIMRKVEELFLSLGSQTMSLVFPLSFFTCDSLTVLDLWNVRLNVPNKVSFPRLKLLVLGFIVFVYGISIENSALKYLYIENCSSFGNSTLKICAPNLSTINYGIKEPGDFVIDSFRSLVEADIALIFGARASVLIKLLEKISNVKLLKMSAACFLLPSAADILLLSAFNNLIHIEVGSSFSYRGSESSDSVSTLRRFFKFLQLSPNLELIVFGQSISIPEEEDDGCWSLDPKCSPPHLKSMKFKCFFGDPAELNAIKLFLKFAGFLETLTIVASSRLSKNQEELINVMKLLLMFPRPANCVVKFLTSSENA